MEVNFKNISFGGSIIFIMIVLGIIVFSTNQNSITENDVFDENSEGNEYRLADDKFLLGQYNHTFEVSNNKGNILPNLQKYECGTGNDDKVLGGINAELGEYPWMALLEYMLANGSSCFKCSGSIINERYILTAAHCLIIQGLFNIRLGEHDLSKQIDCEIIDNERRCAPAPLNIGIEKIIIHEQFTKSLFINDIGLIRLSANIRYTDYMKPVCIYKTKANIFYVSGWGRSSKPTSIKQKLKIFKFHKQKCRDVYASAKKPRDIYKSQICAGGEWLKDACGGDSGGPLMNNYQGVMVVTGIVSYGIGCGRVGIPGVYTKVWYFYDWIKGSLEP